MGKPHLPLSATMGEVRFFEMSRGKKLNDAEGSMNKANKACISLWKSNNSSFGGCAGELWLLSAGEVKWLPFSHPQLRSWGLQE